MTVSDRDRRVLFLAPTARDAASTDALLQSSGIDIATCYTFSGLLDELTKGAGAIVLPEEALAPKLTTRLFDLLATQPAWSDLPVLILTRAGADSQTTTLAVRTLGNVTLLERPVRVGTLVTAVRTALRARERQYQIRGYLKERTEAEAALRLADQRKDEFLATLGHELRNPLTPLLMGLQLLKTSTGGDGADHVKAVMERQINHLVRLVDDLLEVSRITRGLIEIHREPMDLASAVRYAIDTSRATVESAGHELIVRLPDEPITVAGDAVRLTQVFANLIANAAKYTNSSGKIWVTLSREGQRSMVSVRDNGIGIPPAHLKSVFDMFMQVDRSGRRAQGGLGIGLTLVRSLVEMHGGRVEAHSAGLGTGSEFVVELPTAPAASMPADVPERVESLPACRILLVDDNPDAVETIATLLAALGATVATANSGREALGMLDRVRPDTVLLDIGMPEMDGHEVARRIRALPQHAGALLIALTGWGQDQDLALSSAAGFDHHMVKPPDIHRLRAILTQPRREATVHHRLPTLASPPL
jgi:signal transduction histidine kinase/ActR/RegA family two-component response regulator